MPTIRLGVVRYEHKPLVIESAGQTVGQQVDTMIADWLSRPDGDLHEIAVAFEPGDTSRFLAIREANMKPARTVR